MKKLSYILSMLAVIGFFMMAPAPAQAGWLEFFFPSLRDAGPDPAQTLQAPFAEGAEEAENATEVTPLPENAIPLEKPHRVTAEIGEWVMVAVSEAMTFESPDYKTDLDNTADYFDQAGRQQYTAFLEAKNVMKVLQSKKYFVRSFVQDTPILLNHGNVKGRYRWLYEVPVMVSYMDKSMTDYKNAEPVNQAVILKLQVGRSEDAGAHGVLIESWEGKVRKIDKK